MSDTKRPAQNKRPWRRFLLAFVGVLLLLTLLYPLWLPWALKPVAKHWGLRFEDYQRHGYAALELTHVVWTNQDLTLAAQRVQVQMPHRWLWTRMSGDAGSEPQLQGEDWRLQSHPQPATSAEEQGSTADLLDDFQLALPPLAAWVHSIVLTNGGVELHGTKFSVESIELRDEMLFAEALDARATADLSSLANGSLALTLSNKLGTADVQFKRDESRWNFDGEVNCLSNRLELKGWFDRGDWFPAAATLGSGSMSVPSTLLDLGDFGDLGGSAQVVWTNSTYRFDIDLSSESQTDSERALQGLSIQIGGGGDFTALELRRLELTAPFLRANLNSPLTFDFSGSIQGWNTTLNLWADLGQIESIDSSGQLSGRIAVQPSLSSPFRADFSLSGAAIGAFGLRLRATSIEGRINWPTVQVTNMTAEMLSGGRLMSDLQIDVVERRIQKLNWKFDGPWSNALPKSVRLETIHAHGTAAGIWPDLMHTGKVEIVGLETDAFRAAIGHLEWRGQGLVLDPALVRLENGETSLEVEGKVSAQVEDGLFLQADWNKFNVITGTGVWGLAEPFQFTWRNRTNGHQLTLSPLELRGPDSVLTMQSSIEWPARGSGKLTIQGLRSSHLRDFLVPEIPELQIPDASLDFSWDNSPLLLKYSGAAQWLQSSNQVWSLAGQAEASPQSLQFNSFHLDLNEVPCVELEGSLPVRVEPASGWNVVKSDSSDAAHFNLRVVEQGPIWTVLRRRTGLEVDSPKIEFEARGELPDLRGELRFNAGRLRWANTTPASTFVIPDLKKLRVTAVLTRTGIELTRADAEVLDQLIQTRAHWDVGASNWTDWWKNVRQPDWERIHGTIQMQDAQLSAISTLVPGILAPAGTVDLDLSLDPGRRVTGHLSVTNAATRFFKPVGSLRDIQADITLDGWDATLNQFSATLGGHPVKLNGGLSWRSDGDRQFDLRLVGENLSLIRDPDLFLRADLDLRLNKNFGQSTRLSGDVKLRRSLLFRDFYSLVGFDRDQPDQRPPYFSISEPPFEGWGLDVRVKGDQFMEVFSPAFKGQVSANLQLLGTLREPFTIGAVTVDSGKVLFPFGTLQIERGRVDLMREDPYRPKVNFRAVGQNFGYTVTVEAEGYSDSPNLTFQSVPPLTAQQILLMLSAGEIPRSDFGYSASDKASRVGFYIGKELVNRFIGNTSTMERLTLRSGEYITDDGKPTYLLEYRFNDRWSIFGEYNRFRDFNSGLKFKVLSK